MMASHVESGRAFMAFLADLPTDDTTTIVLADQRILICGDCGPLPSNTNECAGCGGYAQPMPNHILMGRAR